MAGFRIFRFIAEKVNGLKVVEINPKGESIQISGKVGAGKTSVIDTLLQTFTGGLVLKEGEKEGLSAVEISDGEKQFKIVRKVKDNGSPTLNVLTGPEYDMKLTRPADFLRTLVGKDAVISPTMFTHVKGGGNTRKQILFEALGIDTSTEDNKIAILKQKRTILNHEINTLRVNLKNNPINYKLSKEVLSATELIEELNKANKQNQELQNGLDVLARDVKSHKKDIADMKMVEEDIKAMEQKLIDMKNQYQKRIEQIAKVGAKLTEQEKMLHKTQSINTIYLEEQIAQIDEQNDVIRQNNEQRKKEIELAEKQDGYSDLGLEIKQIESHKQAAIDNIMPIEGLSIGEDDVFYSVTPSDTPVPSSKWSTGESIFLGCAIRIAQGDNSKLKTVFVDDVSLLDVETLERLRELLGDYQVFEIHNNIVGKPFNVITIAEGEVVNEKN